jgi:hypothetical protein
MQLIGAAIFSVFLTLPIPPIDSVDAGGAVRVAQAEQEVSPAPVQSGETARIPAFWIILPD